MIRGRVLKGFILSVWIGVLVAVALFACSGDISRTANEGIADFLLRTHYRTLANPTPNQLLSTYLVHYQNPPPIRSLLDFTATNPLYIKHDPTGSQVLDREEYAQLFSKLTFQLRARCTAGNDLQKPEMELIIPTALGGTGKPEKVRLPSEVVSWLTKEKIRIDKQKQLDELIDTFILLIALGGFGNIIFLTRDFITGQNDILLSAYLFRPVLGAFLAVAIFIIDIVAHSVVSTAEITKIRHETLFLLALAAGLLSDHAYDVINTRSKLALERWGQKLNQRRERSTTGQS